MHEQAKSLVIHKIYVILHVASYVGNFSGVLTIKVIATIQNKQ